MSAVIVSTAPKQVHATPGCYERVSQALGRCWKWVINCWHWLVHKVFRTVDAVAFGFFRVVEWLSPTLALRMESGYGYFSAWYARHTSAIQEEILQKQLNGLENVNRGLNQRVQEVATQSSLLEVANQQATSERDLLRNERDSDIRARAEANRQKEQAEQACKLINDQNQFLKAETDRLQKALQEEALGRAPILTENLCLRDEQENLKQSQKLLQFQLDGANMQRDFANQSLLFWGRLNGVLAQVAPPL